jgi:PLP dependent protein
VTILESHKNRDSLKDRYLTVKQQIEAAAKSDGRDAQSVMLIAVSKYAGIEQVRELISLGHRDFGENYVHSLLQKASMIDEWSQRQRTLPSALPPGKKPAPGGSVQAGMPLNVSTGATGSSAGIRWHLIGHLQRNKVKKAVEFSRLIHTVDSLRVAEDIQLVANKLGRPVDVLLQVNTSGESSKSGIAPAAAMHLVEAIETMVHVRVRGLMTMAPHSDNPEDSRPTFSRCRELYDEIRRSGLGGEYFNILSMGMSADYLVAISEGSNLVRVGSAIFGEREEEMEDPSPKSRDTDKSLEADESELDD